MDKGRGERVRRGGGDQNCSRRGIKKLRGNGWKLRRRRRKRKQNVVSGGGRRRNLKVGEGSKRSGWRKCEREGKGEWSG